VDLLGQFIVVPLGDFVVQVKKCSILFFQNFHHVVKMIHYDDIQNKTFVENELNILQSISHSNIVGYLGHDWK
jgi:hypothetical protein